MAEEVSQSQKISEAANRIILLRRRYSLAMRELAPISEGLLYLRLIKTTMLLAEDALA